MGIATPFFSVTITGVVPDDWTSQGFGAYVSPGLGDSGIIQQVLPALIASTDELLGEFSDQFGVTEDWDTVDYDDGRSWTISSNTDGSLLYDVALAEDDGLLFIVVLVTIPENRDVLYDEVLLPALAAVDVLE